MPITSSAKKALRQSVKRRIRNVKQKDALKAIIKNYRLIVSQSKKDDARKMLPKVYQALDKAAKHGKALKKNAASRLKSRLASSLDKLG